MCLAIPGKILTIEGEDFARTARVSFAGIVREFSLAYVPEATVGDWNVIVHVGFAISLIDEVEAMRTFADYRRVSLTSWSHPSGNDTRSAPIPNCQRGPTTDN